MTLQRRRPSFITVTTSAVCLTKRGFAYEKVLNLKGAFKTSNKYGSDEKNTVNMRVVK